MIRPCVSLYLCCLGFTKLLESINLCCAVLSCFSRVQLFATLWTVALQAPLSMGFSRQEYWSGLLCPPPGDLPDPGIEPRSLTSPQLAGGLFTTSTTWEAPIHLYLAINWEKLSHYFFKNNFWLHFLFFPQLGFKLHACRRFYIVPQVP